MSITINELTIEVPGNVVKNFTGDTSKLRVTQEQAQAIYDSLGPVLDFFTSQAAAANGSVSVSSSGVDSVLTPVQSKASG